MTAPKKAPVSTPAVRVNLVQRNDANHITLGANVPAAPAVIVKITTPKSK